MNLFSHYNIQDESVYLEFKLYFLKLLTEIILSKCMHNYYFPNQILLHILQLLISFEIPQKKNFIVIVPGWSLKVLVENG